MYDLENSWAFMEAGRITQGFRERAASLGY
jgi:hypothetical protein